MACSVCGGRNHNKRTCTAATATGSNSKDKVPHDGESTRGLSTSTAAVGPLRDIELAIISGNTLKQDISDIRKALLKITAKTSIAATSASGDKDPAWTQKCTARRKSLGENREANRDNRTEYDCTSATSLVRVGGGLRKSTGVNWLNENALMRLAKGPTQGDGPGYIYIYKVSNPESTEEKNCYKIGLSKDLPARRIYVQQRANKQKYESLFTAATPYRYMTEKVIHFQLQSQHTPRSDGLGKTEWFTGHKDFFIDTIKKVIREVNVLA